MSALTTKAIPSLSARHIHERAINAIAELLRSNLSVPEIYLEPRITPSVRPDILAVDKAGTGDLHAVEIKVLSIFPTRTQLLPLTERLRVLPYHYKYLAIPSFGGESGDARRFAEIIGLFVRAALDELASFRSSLKYFKIPLVIQAEIPFDLLLPLNASE